MVKEIICTVCPMGCRIQVEGEGSNVNSVNGYTCNRGLEYAKTEFVSPERILTTLVKIDGVEGELLPVRSNKRVPKDKIFEIMEEVKKASVMLPIKMHQVIINNVCDTGADIIATKELN